MIDLKELPKDPIEALQVILVKMAAKAQGDASIEKLKKGGHPIYTDLMIASLAGLNAAHHIRDEDVRDEVIRLLALQDQFTLNGYGVNIQKISRIVLAIQFSDHVISAEDSELFNEADLSREEKSEISKLMIQAREMARTAEYLKTWQKKNILYYISRIENEILRERTRLETFLAAVQQVSGLVKQVGEDAKPLAEAFSEALTITERRVEGYRRIEAEEKPKQIEDKSKSD